MRYGAQGCVGQGLTWHKKFGRSSEIENLYEGNVDLHFFVTQFMKIVRIFSRIFFSHLEGSFSHLEGSFSYLEGSFSYLEGTFSYLEGTFSYLEGTFSHLEGTFSYLEGTFWYLEGSFWYLEGSFSQRKNTEKSRTLVKRNLN